MFPYVSLMAPQPNLAKALQLAMQLPQDSTVGVLGFKVQPVHEASNISLQNCHLGRSCDIAMAWSMWAAYNFTYQFAKNLRWKDSCFISSSRWTCSVQCPWLRVHPSDSTELLSIRTFQSFLFHTSCVFVPTWIEVLIGSKERWWSQSSLQTKVPSSQVDNWKTLVTSSTP